MTLEVVRVGQISHVRLLVKKKLRNWVPTDGFGFGMVKEISGEDINLGQWKEGAW